MSLWWNDSLHLVLDKDDARILREMDFIARSLMSRYKDTKKISKTEFENIAYLVY